MNHKHDESPIFRQARERIRTSKELVKTTKELVAKSSQKAIRWKNNKTPEESHL